MKPIHSPNFMLYAVAAFVLAGLMSVGSVNLAWGDDRGIGSRIAAFDGFMREHPKASTELRQNPDLVYNRRWLDKHPEVDHFLKGRPELRNEIARRPYRVFGSNRYDGGRNERYGWRHDRFGGGHDRRDWRHGPDEHYRARDWRR